MRKVFPSWKIEMTQIKQDFSTKAKLVSRFYNDGKCYSEDKAWLLGFLKLLVLANLENWWTIFCAITTMWIICLWTIWLGLKLRFRLQFWTKYQSHSKRRKLTLSWKKWTLPSLTCKIRCSSASTSTAVQTQKKCFLKTWPSPSRKKDQLHISGEFNSKGKKK